MTDDLIPADEWKGIRIEYPPGEPDGTREHRLDILIETWEESSYIYPWWDEDSPEEKREKLEFWLNSGGREVGPKYLLSDAELDKFTALYHKESPKPYWSEAVWNCTISVVLACGAITFLLVILNLIFSIVAAVLKST